MDVSTVTETVSAVAADKVQVLSTFLIGFGTVFVALIALVFIIKIMGGICGKLVKKKPEVTVPVKKSASVNSQKTEQIENRGEIIAAASAAIATVMGKDVEAIRIVSMKKVD